MLYLLDFIFFVLIYFLVFFQKWKKYSNENLFSRTVMYCYIVMVLYVTLMPFTLPLEIKNNLFIETANFIPFRDLRLGYHGAVREIYLNIIMMVPFGFLLPLIKKRGLVRTVLATFLFSLLIESTQLLSVWFGSAATRIFDVTDLITNTLGGLIGFLLFIILRFASTNKS